MKLALMFSLMSLVLFTTLATASASPNATCRNWNKCSIYQKHEFVHQRQTKALSVISFFLNHPKIARTDQGRKVMRKWRHTFHKTIRNLDAIHNRLAYCRPNYGQTSGTCAYSWTTRYNAVSEIIRSYDWSPTSDDGAIQVVRCETGNTFDPAERDNGTSQFIGLFQMGAEARRYATEYPFKSSDHETARNGSATSQVEAAYRLYVAGGRSWSQWACRPDGSIAY